MPPVQGFGDDLRPTKDMPPVQGFDEQSAVRRDPVPYPDHEKIRKELEKPIEIPIRAKMDYGTHTQFARASMRRETNREVREASYNAYADIGAA